MIIVTLSIIEVLISAVIAVLAGIIIIWLSSDDTFKGIRIMLIYIGIIGLVFAFA